MKLAFFRIVMNKHDKTKDSGGKDDSQNLCAQ